MRQHFKRVVSAVLATALVAQVGVVSAWAAPFKAQEVPAAAGMHPFTGTPDLIRSAAEELKAQGVTAQEKQQDEALVQRVETTADKSYDAVKSDLAQALVAQRGEGTVDVADLMQDVEGRMFEISQNNLKKEYTQINPVIGRVYDLLKKAAARTDGLSGLSTGFEKLDRMTSGWQNSDLIIIAARPAMGKTAFVISMVRKMAVDMKTPVAMFSLEMANEQLVQRLMVNVCEISGEKLRSGNLAPHEWGQLDTRVSLLYDAPIYVDDTPSLSIFELRTKARRLVREHGVKIIMIDYLQLMNASGMSFGSRQEEVSTISRSLKGLAKELNIPIIALSQLNRGVESREGNEGKRPQLSDLRESGAIEQDADIVCFIHRPEYYKIYQDEKGRDMPTVQCSDGLHTALGKQGQLAHLGRHEEHG